MANYTVYMLGASQISVSGGKSLSGYSQGDGSHLVGETITLNAPDWEEVRLRDNDPNFEDNDRSQGLQGTQRLDGERYGNNTGVEAEYRIVLEDSGGTQYEVIGLNLHESGSGHPTYGTVEGLAFIGPQQGWPPVGEPLSVVSASEGPRGSTTPYQDYVTPCFTPGTRIDTPHGPRRVETLRTGELVRTLDDGAQRLRWIGRVHVDAARLAAEPHLAPVRIARGALGGGLPRRDLVVSPQHHVLLGGWRAALHFGCDEMLCAAKHLADGRAIRTDRPRGGVTYIHLLFDRHQIVFAEGTATESFYPGPQTLPGLAPPQQAELFALFPHLARGLPFGPPARPVMTGWEGRMMAA